MRKYLRADLEVEAQKYEVGKDMEDGFELLSSIVTKGWVPTEQLIKVTNPSGSIVCPFIENRRGLIFIREGDFIIYEEDGERHVCGADKFRNRYRLMSE